jgi:methionyl-tRNA formyltransferase
MLLREALAIGPYDTTGRLHDRLAALGGRLIVQALQAAERGTLQPEPQPAEGVTYAHKIDKAEAAIDWRLPATLIERRVRAFDPFPGASFTLGDQPVKLWRAAVRDGRGAPGTALEAGAGHLVVACGEGALELLELQAAGGRRQAASHFLPGHPVAVGGVLGGVTE